MTQKEKLELAQTALDEIRSSLTAAWEVASSGKLDSQKLIEVMAHVGSAHGVAEYAHDYVVEA